MQLIYFDSALLEDHGLGELTGKIRGMRLTQTPSKHFELSLQALRSAPSPGMRTFEWIYTRCTFLGAASVALVCVLRRGVCSLLSGAPTLEQRV